MERLEPALVFATDGAAFERPLSAVANPRTEVVYARADSARHFTELAGTTATSRWTTPTHASAPDTVAKILFTSGSTGTPKGVITTQRMLCSNQEMLRTLMAFLADEPPVLCDWLPWNHTFGGSHNFGIALYNGGHALHRRRQADSSRVSDHPRQSPRYRHHRVLQCAEGLRDARCLPSAADPDLCRHFFSRLQILFYAAAGLNQRVWDDLQDLAVETCGEEILMMTGLGATESAPMATGDGVEGASAGRVGLPVPGVELKLAPVESKMEARLRGPNITPGFWRDPELTRRRSTTRVSIALATHCCPRTRTIRCRASSSTDGWRKTSSSRPAHGSVSDRCARDFLIWFGGIAKDVVLAAPDRDYVAALIFPAPGATPLQRSARCSKASRSAPPEFRAECSAPCCWMNRHPWIAENSPKKAPSTKRPCCATARRW